MNTKIRKLIRQEVVTIFLSLIITGISFVILAIWRRFDSETFSFLQIIVVIILVSITLYLVSFLSEGYVSKLLKRRELAAIAISFSLLSFFVLNIDRSRSVYLIKWVASHEPAGVSKEQLSTEHRLFGRDLQDLLQRIDEQKSSKNLEEVAGELHLTSQGTLLARIFEFIAKFENLNGYSRG